MKTSIFSTPVLSPCLRFLANAGLKLSGWKVVGNPPPPPYVIIAAPHTSNWDFLLMLAIVFHLQMDIRWMGKHTLFPPLIAPLARWLGGLAINRTHAHNAVNQMVHKFREEPDLALVITPEGTRQKVTHWKTGFYHIAYQASVPIAMVGIDGKNKEARFLGIFQPNGETENELGEIKQNFQNFTGIKSENSGK